jgi:hypothetical protein
MALEDNNQILVTRKANVLFMLDTGSPMTFTAKGKMPEWGVNAHTPQQAGQMLREATYGHGGLPVAGTGAIGYSYGGLNRYGREGPDTEDEANNITMATLNLDLHADNYYSPFNYANNPVSGANPAPYALVFKNSSWWKNGPPAGTIINKDTHLVPNDSRMYKMKLVMWRVLSDVVLIENLRMGLATTYQEMNTPDAGFYADYYKASPYGAFNPNFPYGTAPSWSTSLVDSFANGYAYADSAAAFWGINREYYDYGHNTNVWKLLNRAYLRVPMDDYSSEHLEKFRLWIDGYEDLTRNVASDPYYYKNPELFADGKTFLSTAIYPGHSDLDRTKLLNTIDPANQRAVTFSSVNGEVKAAMDGGAYLNKLFNIFKRGSGEALGTILDFFSPPVATIGEVSTNASNVEFAPEVSFPLSDECDKNWVVIFTAGDDSSEYSSAQAVADLYAHTKNKNLTMLKRGSDGKPVKLYGQNQFEPIKLQEGVRTLVVGFVDPKSNEPDIVALRKKLNDMAKAGDPNNPYAAAYFANDVSGLVQALRSVLARINSEIQPAAGPLTESPAMGDEEEENPNQYNIFSAGYRINKFDQWNGTFARYRSVKGSGDITTTELWELGRDLHNSVTPGSRELVYWGQGSFKQLEFTISKSNATLHPLANTFGVTAAFVANSMDASNVPGKTFAGKLHPSRALVNWLHGYEYSYVESKELLRRSLLSDFGQSTSVIVGPPQAFDAFPGYREWTALPAQKNLATRIYAQTNDGILHVINPSLEISQKDREQMAIVPPPSLLPLRLAGLKMAKVGDGDNYKLRWLDVLDFMTATSDDIPISSKPAYVLDGPVRMRRFDMNPNAVPPDDHKWKAILIAMLGRGGNGLYTMDVTSPDIPQFYWYRETIENKDDLTLVRMRADDDSVDTMTVKPNWANIYSYPDSYPFYQLGFNSLNTAAGVSWLNGEAGKYRNMIVLPGGMQRSFDLENNGKMGAALYIIDPDESKHTDFNNASGWAKVYNGGSVDPDWRIGSEPSGDDPYMGMMVSAPTLHASQYSHPLGKYVAGQIYASDNRGNIFALLLESTSENSSIPFKERLLTVGSLRKSTDEPTASYASPYSVIITRRPTVPDVWWVSGGTANVAGSTHLQNKSQLIYSFKLPNFDTGETSLRDNWVELKSNDVNSKIDPTDPTKQGWYIPLEPEGASQNYKEEYVSAQPVLFDNQIIFATFLQKKIDTDAVSEKCQDAVIDGKGRIYAFDMDTGAGGLWTDLDGEKPVSVNVSIQGDIEIITDVVNEESSSENAQIVKKKGFFREKWHRGRRYLKPRKGKKYDDDDPSIPPETTYINYWLLK